MTPLVQIQHHWCKYNTTGANTTPLVRIGDHCCEYDITGSNIITMVQNGANMYKTVDANATQQMRIWLRCRWCEYDSAGANATRQGADS